MKDGNFLSQTCAEPQTTYKLCCAKRMQLWGSCLFLLKFSEHIEQWLIVKLSSLFFKLASWHFYGIEFIWHFWKNSETSQCWCPHYTALHVISWLHFSTSVLEVQYQWKDKLMTKKAVKGWKSPREQTAVWYLRALLRKPWQEACSGSKRRAGQAGGTLEQ